MPDGNSTSIDLDGPDNIKGNVDDEIVPSDSNFDNKSFNLPGGGTNGYLQKLGLPDDGSSSGMDSYAGVKFTNQGQVSTALADNQTTNLTLRIESTSLFQIAATYLVLTTPSNYISLWGFSYP